MPVDEIHVGEFVFYFEFEASLKFPSKPPLALPSHALDRDKPTHIYLHRTHRKQTTPHGIDVYRIGQMIVKCACTQIYETKQNVLSCIVH